MSIGGSWCPNCHDEAPFLSELFKDYHARGLEIVGLMFENDPDPKVARPRVQSFIKRYAIQYPMLIAGTTQPSPTSKTSTRRLPQSLNFGRTRPPFRDATAWSEAYMTVREYGHGRNTWTEARMRDLTERCAEPIVSSVVGSR